MGISKDETDGLTDQGHMKWLYQMTTLQNLSLLHLSSEEVDAVRKFVEGIGSVNGELAMNNGLHAPIKKVVPLADEQEIVTELISKLKQKGFTFGNFMAVVEKVEAYYESNATI